MCAQFWVQIKYYTLFGEKKRHMNQSTWVQIQAKKITSHPDPYLFFKLHSIQTESDMEKKKKKMQLHATEDQTGSNKKRLLDPVQDSKLKLKFRSLPLHINSVC